MLILDVNLEAPIGVEPIKNGFADRYYNRSVKAPLIKHTPSDSNRELSDLESKALPIKLEVHCYYSYQTISIISSLSIFLSAPLKLTKIAISSFNVNGFTIPLITLIIVKMPYLVKTLSPTFIVLESIILNFNVSASGRIRTYDFLLVRQTL